MARFLGIAKALLIILETKKMVVIENFHYFWQVAPDQGQILDCASYSIKGLYPHHVTM